MTFELLCGDSMALDERADCVVEWNGCFRGTDEDPRECGWCVTCGREVYDNDGQGHVLEVRDER